MTIINTASLKRKCVPKRKTRAALTRRHCGVFTVRTQRLPDKNPHGQLICGSADKGANKVVTMHTNTYSTLTFEEKVQREVRRKAS